MKNTISKILTLALVIILSGCAAKYRSINPQTIYYNSHDSQDGISLSYKHDVLREKRNRKYANKEHKSGVRLVAIKLTNNTDAIINVGRDITFYSGQNQIFPLEPMAIKESIKQLVPGYLPYLLLTFTNLYIRTGTTTETYRIGLILGPAITLGNMLMASSANKKMLNELYDYNILSKDIQKGETIYGIIGVRDMGYSPISVKLKK